MTGSTFQHALLVFLVVAFLATTAWFTLGTGDPPPEIDQVLVYRPENNAESKTVHIDAPPQDAKGPASCRVDVTLETIARVLPDRPPRPVCELVSSLRSISESGIAGEWVAGLAALSLAREAQGQQLVRFRLADGSDHYRVTRLRSDDRGTIRLLRGRMMITSGIVVDERGRPVKDAKVWLAGFSTTTDEDGFFSIDAMPAESGLPIVVRKRGFTPIYTVLSGAQYAALHQRSLVLRPGVELNVRFTSRASASESASESRFFLLPSDGRDTRLLSYPFFFAAIEPMHELRDGMAVFDGLPPGARVRVRMLRPGFAPATSDEIRLDKAVVATIIQGDLRQRVSGTVVDSSDKPVPFVWLTTRPGDSGLSLRDTGWLMPPGAYVADGDVVRTTKTGAFALSLLADRRNQTVLAVESEGCTGLAYVLTGRGDKTVKVRLFGTRPAGTPQIRLEAGSGLPSMIRLTVHDESGDHGPYTWQSKTPFPIRISRRSLLRIRLRVDDEDPIIYDDVLVVGDTGLSVVR